MNNTTPISSLEGYIWINGEFIENKHAKIHPLTHSLHYSGAVFEGIKSVKNNIFKIDEHLERLFNSAQYMELEIKYSKDQLTNTIYELLKKNNLTKTNAYIRPLVWRDANSLMLNPDNFETNILIAAWEPFKSTTQTSLKLNLSNWIKPTEQMAYIQCKNSAQYSLYRLVISDAKKKGFDESIMLDINGYIAECTTTNIFFIKEDKLITPTTKYALNGITRQTILKIAEEMNINAEIIDISPDQIEKMDSCFITGTSAGVKEVNSVNIHEQKIELATDNIIFKKFKERYMHLLEK